MSNNDYDEDISKEEEFKISNLISFLEENHIVTKGVFSYEKQVVFLYVEIAYRGIEMFIYIPKKYTIILEKNLGISCFEIIPEEDNDEEESTFNPKNILIRSRMNKVRSMNRFLPIFKELKYKVLYIDNYYLTYINRHNEVEYYTMTSPTNMKSYFFITDLEHFYKNKEKLLDDLMLQESSFTQLVCNKLSSESIQCKQSLEKASQIVKNLNPQQVYDNFKNRMTKLKVYLGKNDDKSKKASILSSKTRAENLKSMFEMESIIYTLNELCIDE